MLLAMKDKNEIDLELLKLNEELSVFKREEIREQIIGYINYLLLHDFNKLVHLLYRVDVNEQKLREILNANPGSDAAVLITGLLIQRQEEKSRIRESFKPDKEIPDEEKW